MFEKILTFTRKRHVAGLKCAFTGHRPQNLPFRFDETDERCLRLKAELRNLIVQMIEQKNVTHFISGMALGIDTYAAEMVLDLKTDFPFIITMKVKPQQRGESERPHPPKRPSR